MIARQQDPSPFAPRRKGEKAASLKPQSERTHPRHRDDSYVEGARETFRRRGVVERVKEAACYAFWMVL